MVMPALGCSRRAAAPSHRLTRNVLESGITFNAPEENSGLKVHYDSPYTLMAVMGTNVNLNLVVGALLLLAYLVVLAGVLLG